MDILRRAARRTPNAPAVLDPPTLDRDTPWTFAQLDARSDAVARSLARNGLATGKLVAMKLPPCPEAIVLLHAVPRAGAALLILHPGWTSAETSAGLDAALTSADLHRASLAAAGRPDVLLVEDPGEVAELWKADGSPSVGSGRARDAEEPLFVVLTSGSTGTPRAVPIAGAKLESSAELVSERLGLRADDVWLASLPIAHIGGLALLHRAAAIGCAVLTRARFEAAEVGRWIDEGRFTHASLVPVMVRRVLEARGGRIAPATLRCLLVGGAAIRPDLLREALSLGYPIALTYGMTETTSQVAAATPGRVRRKPGTAGPPLRGLEVRIDSVGHGGGPVGEILVRGPTVVSEPSLAPEGWFATGDLGRLDPDGDLWITGRVSERVVTGGVTVEPAEVEAALREHAGIRELAVIGVQDDEWGERLVAVVVPRDPSSPPTLSDLLRFSRERLGPAKRPRGLRIVPELPRTATGKPDRMRLRELCQE